MAYFFILQEAQAIEVDDTNIRMSPIMILRNRSSHFSTDFDDTGASLRTTVPRVSYPSARASHAPVMRRRNVANTNLQKRRKVITSIKRKAKEFRQKIPSVKDVNKIDKYARLVFPSLFVVFNICYWCFYLMQ